MAIVTGNKVELAAALKVSLPTLSAWMMRYRPDFPIQEAGANGRSYVFDFKAVFDFLRAKQDEQARSRAERDEQLAQLKLPFEVGGAEAPIANKPTVAEEIKAWQLRRIQREEAERSGALVPTDQVVATVSTVLSRLSRDTRAFLQQLAREHDWPPSYAQALLARYGDTQRAAVKDLQQQFGGVVGDERQHA